MVDRDQVYTVANPDSPVNRGEKDANIMGTVAYMAPEFLLNKISTRKSDVYSFGILLWELYYEQEVFEDLNEVQIQYGILEKEMRPNLSEDMPKRM